MSEISSTTKGALDQGGPPQGNPMNLTCTGTNLGAADSPSAVMIVIYDSDDPLPSAPNGWDTWLPADSNATYDLDINKGKHPISGKGVAIYYQP